MSSSTQDEEYNPSDPYMHEPVKSIDTCEPSYEQAHQFLVNMLSDSPSLTSPSRCYPQEQRPPSHAYAFRSFYEEPLEDGRNWSYRPGHCYSPRDQREPAYFSPVNGPCPPYYTSVAYEPPFPPRARPSFPAPYHPNYVPRLYDTRRDEGTYVPSFRRNAGATGPSFHPDRLNMLKEQQQQRENDSRKRRRTRSPSFEDRDNRPLHHPLRRRRTEDRPQTFEFVQNTPPSDTVFVCNVPYEATEKDIYQFFNVCGQVLSVRVLDKKKRDGSTRKRMAFIKYTNVETARQCIDRFHKSEYQGRTLFLSFAESRRKNRTSRDAGTEPHKPRESSNSEIDFGSTAWSG